MKGIRKGGEKGKGRLLRSNEAKAKYMQANDGEAKLKAEELGVC